MRSRPIVIAVTIASMAGAVPAMARPAHRHVGRAPEGTVTATFHDPGAPGFTNARPDCPDANHGGCAFAFDGTTGETGDLTGSTTYHGWLYPGDSPQRAFRWQVDETFTGKIAQCGRGTVRWTGSGYGDLTSFDPTSQSARMWGTVKIIGGSGTGDFRGLTGTLSVEARAHALPPAAQDGTLTGRLSCGE